MQLWLEYVFPFITTLYLPTIKNKPNTFDHHVRLLLFLCQYFILPGFGHPMAAAMSLIRFLATASTPEVKQNQLT